jgi:hypothetical protein
MFYIIALNTVAANSNFKPKHQAHAFSKFTNEEENISFQNCSIIATYSITRFLAGYY